MSTEERETTPVSLAALRPGDELHGFTARARYLDDDRRARGARFVHARKGFVFDYLAIESAPQAFVWTTTYPTSDGGEPHTQEHLLLGKGNKGRFLGNYDHVMLVSWSAATWQYRTGYHLRTAAGPAAFFGVLFTQLDALLHPDYSDEEIRREVRNFGVAQKKDGRRSLEEKGTVYTEMVRTYESADTRVWDALGRMVYGDGHPLALSSGGTPAGIRTLLPEDIRRFHAAHYRLANMGMAGAFPAHVGVAEALREVSAILDRLEGAPGGPPPMTEADVPEANGAAPGSLAVVPYPHATEGHPGPAIFSWPATRRLGIVERTLLELFVGAFAGGEGSTMYRALVDGKTRALDVGATGVWASVMDDPGQPIYLGLTSTSPARADVASLREVRALLLEELARIASLEDCSAELAAFGERVRARIVEARRAFDKFLDTPPQFGSRGIGDYWVRLLADLEREGGFDRSLTAKDAYDQAEVIASSRENPWRARIARWGLLEAPYGVVAKASPELLASLDAEKGARTRAEVLRLRALYGAADDEAALARLEAEIAEKDEELARAEALVPMPPFVSDPPMSLDDSLAFARETTHGIASVTSTFDGMKSATVGLALRVDGVADADLPYLSLLPPMLREVGILEDGVPLPYDAMRDRLRREVLDVSAYFDTSFASDRAELALQASGNDVEETRRALGWIRAMLTRADWREENLPRIRDVVNRQASRLRQVMTGPEERWVSSVSEAYRRQDSAVLAHTASFLTRAHDAFVVSWAVEAQDREVSALVASLERAGEGLDRAGLLLLAQALARVSSDDEENVIAATAAEHAARVAAARALPAASRARASRAGRELAELLAEVPDSSLAADWAHLTRVIAGGCGADPADALAAFRRVLAAVSHAGGARLWSVGSSRAHAALDADVAELVSALDASPAPVVARTPRPWIEARARSRGAATHDGHDGHDGRLAALVNPSTANGAVVCSAPTARYDDTHGDALVDFLAANVLSGTGAHSLYKRVWGAGLSYGGGIGASPRSGRMHVYFERSPDLRQLFRFVAGEVRRTPEDARFVDYAIANAFSSRTAETYETRAHAMATDLAEGVTPERVRAFREGLLAARGDPRLATTLHERLTAVAATVVPTVVPTLAAASKVPDGALWFAVAPEAQLASYEEELRAARGEALTILRLYPRDYWDVAAVTSTTSSS